MLKELFHYIYCMSIPSTVFVLIFVCCLWNILNSRVQKSQLVKIWKALNLVLFAVWFVCIIYMTIFSRGNKTEVNFIPFRFIYKPFITGNEEFFRTGWMNILLFVPGSMWLSYGIGKSTRIKRALLISLFIILSVCIEIIQWYYKLGTVETDDVICNSIGAIIGVTSIIWAFRITRIAKSIILRVMEYIKNLIHNIINEIKLVIKKP